MKSFTFLLVLLCWWSSNSMAATTVTPSEPILILGDSLSASYGMTEQHGWVSLLAERYPELNIINASVSGETSGGGLRRLPSLLTAHQPRWIFVALGGNDGLRGFPPAITEKNLAEIVALSQQAGTDVLLSEVQLPPNYGPRYAQQFAQIFKNLQQDQQITLVPFFMVPIAPNPELMQADGIHPNRQAQPLIAEFMAPWLTTLMP